MRVSPHELTLPHYNAAVRMSDRSRETQCSVQKTATGRFGPITSRKAIKFRNFESSFPAHSGCPYSELRTSAHC